MRFLLPVLVLLAAAPQNAAAAVDIDADQIVVDAGAARAVVQMAPYRLHVTDGAGSTVLSELENPAAPPLLEPPTVDPEPNGGDALPETTLYAPLTFTVGTERIDQIQAGTWVANLQTAERSGIQYSARDVVSAVEDGDGARLVVSTNDPTWRRLVVVVRPRGRDAIHVSVRPTPDDGVSVVADSFASGPDEAFRGFGGRHNALDQRGGDFESFLNQSNVSPGRLEPAVAAAPGTGGDRYMFPNGPEGAYFVQSQFISSRPYGFLALRDELTRWRMASDRPDAWQVAASARGLDYVVAPGNAPRAIDTLTEITGRHRLPPEWALEPMLDRAVRFPAQSPADYRAEVLRDLEDIERYDLPLGSYRIEAWEFFDRATLRDVIGRFRARGIRVLLYFRAFVGRDEIGTDSPARFDEAVEKGYVATNAAGEPFTFTSNFFAPAAVIDFSDPEAVAWWKGRIREALDLGAEGFMQDFGEQVFVDMHFANGETGATMHNRLPVLFHRATREAIDEYRDEHPERGEVFFFTRAGYSGAPGSVAYESATWPGDETTDFTRSSGLASQAPDMLNRGIAGAVGFGTDIGGYFDPGHDPTTKELFLRWAEWAALTPVFRLHGSVAAGTHTPWSYDAETVEIYKRLSRLHQAAAPLIHSLWRESTQTGMPIARPLWLAAPGDPEAARQDQEWLLGPDVLVAPIVEQGATSRDVYFPEGCWERVGDGARFPGRSSARVAAALGELPYFFRCGTTPFEPPAELASAGGGPLGLPASRRCLSRRRFDIRLREPGDRRLRSARVSLNGRRVAVRHRRGRLVARIDLRGRPRTKVTVRAVARTRGGRRVRESRSYRTCVPRRPATRRRQR